MPAQADLRLGFLQKFAHSRRTHVHAAGDDVAGRILGRIVRHQHRMGVGPGFLPAGVQPSGEGRFRKFAGRAKGREGGSPHAEYGRIRRERAGHAMEVPAHFAQPLVHFGPVHIADLRPNRGIVGAQHIHDLLGLLHAAGDGQITGHNNAVGLRKLRNFGNAGRLVVDVAHGDPEIVLKVGAWHGGVSFVTVLRPYSAVVCTD